MKKMTKVLAVSALVLFALVSVAPAATVVKKDGFTYKIKGDLQLQYRKDVGIDQNMDIEYDDLEIKNYVSYDINDDMKAFGGLDFGFKNAADKPEAAEGKEDVHLEEAYLGLAYQNFSFTFGKTNSAADEFGVEGAVEISVEDAFSEWGYEDGDDLTRIDVEFENFMIAVAHELDAENEDSENGEFTDVFVGAKFAGFELGAAYQTHEKEIGGLDVELYGVSAAYDAEVAAIAVDYSHADFEDAASDSDVDVWNIYVSAPIAKVFTVGAGYQMIEFDEPYVLMEDAIKTWYVNAAYKLTKKFKVFAEVSDSDEMKSSGEEYDTGFLVGAQLKF